MRDDAGMPAAPAAAHALPLAGDPGDGSGAGDGVGVSRSADRSLAATLLRAPVSGDTWRGYLYLIVAAPLALTAFVTLAVATWVGALLSVVVVGIPLLALIVLGAREYGVVPRALARELLGEEVEAPRRRGPKSTGFLPWLRASLGDLDGWRAIAYIVVAFPVTMVGGWLVVLSTALALALFTYPVFWQVAEPTNTDAQGVVRDSGLQFGQFYIDTWPRALAVSAVGLLALFVIPWMSRAVTTVERLLVRWLLGPTRIGARVDDLEATRAHAVEDSAATLRRIERDLHDGTQARLVALAMHLDMAKEKLGPDGLAGADPDVARARELLDQAHRNATDAITELREVTRSIHPPALDRGLDDALTTLAARSGVPARVRTRLAVRPSPAIETIAYFCVAELLTNVAKHSRAGRALVEVEDRDGVLTLRVTDDGRGGATFVPGGGLAGLAERVRTVDGQLGLSSPAGGPTVATVHLPLGV
jgi:signal transduction histidine kinase